MKGWLDISSQFDITVQLTAIEIKTFGDHFRQRPVFLSSLEENYEEKKTINSFVETTSPFSYIAEHKHYNRITTQLRASLRKQVKDQLYQE